MAKDKTGKSSKKMADVEAAELSWVEAEDGYALALSDGKLVCRNPQGKTLASVPKKIKEGERAEQLMALRDWLKEHDRECMETAETWMLRSLPVPRPVLEAVWPDPSWRKPLENTVIMAMDAEGNRDVDSAGFFKGADPDKGVGVVNLDGETVWLDTQTISIPHPILIEELNDFRELATELSLEQGVSQLFRETWPRPADLDPEATTIGDFSDGKFNQLNHALGKCRTLGYRVRGGFAVCPVWEDGVLVEARYWIGSDNPEYEAFTGDLLWVDGNERALKLSAIGPVAYSEGIRMASAIYAARVVEEAEEA